MDVSRDFSQPAQEMSPDRRRAAIAAILARGILRKRALKTGQAAADPLDSAAETRLSVVNGAESAPNKASRRGARTPRRLSPQHPS